MTAPIASRDLSDAVALVTGASSGIGRATAIALADAGARVGLAARSRGPLDALASDIAARDGTALAVPTDLREDPQVVRMVETVEDAFGGLDILVNNAGVGHWEPIGDADRDEWRREIEVNLLGMMTATHVAVPVMRDRGRGHIVTVSSLSGRYPGAGWPGYTASKFGVRGFTEAILRDLTDDGIRVTLIEPGEVDTPMQSEDARATHRMLDPEDVADAIVYAVTRPAHVCVNDIQLLPVDQHETR